MTQSPSRRTLKAVFELAEQQHEIPADEVRLNLPVPTLDERVEIYLRATNRSAGATDRAVVRQRILDSVAEEMALQALEQADPEPLSARQRLAGTLHRLRETCESHCRRSWRLLSERIKAPVATLLFGGDVGPRLRFAMATLVAAVAVGTILTATLRVVGPNSDRHNPQLSSIPDGRSSTAIQEAARQAPPQIEFKMPPWADSADRAERAGDAALPRADRGKEARSGGDAIPAAEPSSKSFGSPGDAALRGESVAIQSRYNELLAARNYSDALSEAEKLEALARAQFGIEDKRYADVLDLSARIYLAERRYAEAELVLRRILAIRERHLPTTHPDVIATRNQLAEIYRAQGRASEAEELAKRASTLRNGNQAR